MNRSLSLCLRALLWLSTPLACIQSGLMAAHEIALSPETPREVVAQLRSGFPPLDPAMLSMRAAFIGQFCTISDVISSNSQLQRFCRMKRIAQATVPLPLVLNRNETMRLPFSAGPAGAPGTPDDITLFR